MSNQDIKRNPKEFMERFAAQTKPLDYHISSKSIARFLDDDRLGPVEVWIRVRTYHGNVVPQFWEMYADPCDPEPGGTFLERAWRIRKLTLRELGRLPIGECPERIVAGCTPDDDESKFIIACCMANSDEAER